MSGRARFLGLPRPVVDGFCSQRYLMRTPRRCCAAFPIADSVLTCVWARIPVCRNPGRDAIGRKANHKQQTRKQQGWHGKADADPAYSGPTGCTKTKQQAVRVNSSGRRHTTPGRGVPFPLRFCFAGREPGDISCARLYGAALFFLRIPAGVRRACLLGRPCVQRTALGRQPQG